MCVTIIQCRKKFSRNSSFFFNLEKISTWSPRKNLPTPNFFLGDQNFFCLRIWGSEIFFFKMGNFWKKFSGLIGSV
uniref:Uncharacterized protein n=1 Tax=viral metagenome TaxID=1070528 RepID=A0A6C0BPB0_9ZZZZ